VIPLELKCINAFNAVFFEHHGDGMTLSFDEYVRKFRRGDNASQVYHGSRWRMIDTSGYVLLSLYALK